MKHLARDEAFVFVIPIRRVHRIRGCQIDVESLPDVLEPSLDGDAEAAIDVILLDFRIADVSESDVVIRILFANFLHDANDCVSLHADPSYDEVDVHRGSVLDAEHSRQKESAFEYEFPRIRRNRKPFQEAVEEIPRINDVRTDAFLLRDASCPRGKRIPVNSHNPLPPESDIPSLPSFSFSRT